MKYEFDSETKKWLEETYSKILAKMDAECLRIGDKIPYISENGKYVHDMAEKDIYWWTNGFWAGMLWQMYHATGDEKYKNTARAVGKKLDKALEGYIELHHDVGFMWLHSSVADYRLTGSKEARTNGLHAANILAGRYNPHGKFIRAWNGDCTGWIIIDCMMNIPLLYWASNEQKDPRFLYIATDHANTAMEKLVRADGSCNHIGILNPENGELLETPGGQGYAPGSSWSRGHAWAVYGFALSYAHTKNQAYLDTAKKVAHYFIANISGTGFLPLVDFRAPAEPVIFDSTAGVCAACGMLEIAEHVGEFEKPLYINAAVNILKATEKKFCNWDTEFDSIVGNGVASYHGRGGDFEVPIIYGDYFFIEGILRLLEKDFLIW